MNPLCCIAPVSLDRADRAPVLPLRHPATIESPTSITSGKRSVHEARLSEADPVGESEDAGVGDGRASAASTAAAAPGVEGVAGILWKWVNFGKGWRARWFMLQDGVLSYYKIHGPDRIAIGSAWEVGVKVIGEDSLRRVRREQMWGASGAMGPAVAKPWKPFGAVHLKNFTRMLLPHVDVWRGISLITMIWFSERDRVSV